MMTHCYHYVIQQVLVRPALIVEGPGFEHQTTVGDMLQQQNAAPSLSTGSGAAGSMGQWIVSTTPGRMAASMGRGLKQIGLRLRPNSFSSRANGEGEGQHEGRAAAVEDDINDIGEDESLALAHQVCRLIQGNIFLSIGFAPGPIPIGHRLS